MQTIFCEYKYPWLCLYGYYIVCYKNHIIITKLLRNLTDRLKKIDLRSHRNGRVNSAHIGASFVHDAHCTR